MNASARLKRKPAEPVPVPAMERLAAARTRQAYVEKLIEAVEAARREALFVDDDERAAGVDHELAALRLDARRVVDKIALLIPAVEAERQQDWPDDVAACRRLGDKLEKRRDALRQKPKVSRSAADDAELDHLVCYVPALRQRLELLERIA